MKNEISQILRLIEVGNLEKALQEAKNLYRANQNNFDVVKALVYTYIQFGNFEKVILLLDKHFRLRKDKQDFDYHNNIGYALAQTEEFERAIPHLEQAVSINPNNPIPYTNLAGVYQKIMKFEKAQAVIYEAIKIIENYGSESFNKFSNTFLLMSEINSSLKQDFKTIEMFTKILLDKFNENIFYLLTNIDSNSIKNEILIEAEEKLNIKNINFKSKLDRFNYVTPIYFGLGNYYNTKDKKKSENFYINGNQEIFNSSKYNSHNYQQKIIQSIEYYEKYYQEYDEAYNDAGKENFFVVGSPRSGTTLLESIISANNLTFSGGEMTSAKQLIEKQIFTSKSDFDEFIYSFQTKYQNRTSFLRKEYKHIVDKLPENFLYIGYLLKLLPKSKIIRIFRNPWDVATSLFKQRYIITIPFSSSFFNIGVFLSNFEAINFYWSKKLSDHHGLLDINYEDLVKNKEDNINRIYSFLDISIENYSDAKRADFFSPTASIRQVNKEIHQKSMKKEEFLDKKQEFIDAFQMQRQFWIKKGIIDENISIFNSFKDFC